MRQAIAPRPFRHPWGGIRILAVMSSASGGQPTVTRETQAREGDEHRPITKLTAPSRGLPHTTGSAHRYLHSKHRFTGNYLGPICCVSLRKAPGGVLSAGPGKQGIGDGDGLGSTGTTNTDAGRHHCGETRPPKELRRKSLCRYQWARAW